MQLYKNELTPAERNRNKMLRYEYGVYIMLGSYFKKSSISNQMIETRYKLNYAELSGSKQADMEEVVLQLVEEILIPKLSKIKDMDQKEVILTPIPIPGTELHYLKFHGEGFSFTLSLKAAFSPEKHKDVLYANFYKKKTSEKPKE